MGIFGHKINAEAESKREEVLSDLYYIVIQKKNTLYPMPFKLA